MSSRQELPQIRVDVRQMVGKFWDCAWPVPSVSCRPGCQLGASQEDGPLHPWLQKDIDAHISSILSSHSGTISGNIVSSCVRHHYKTIRSLLDRGLQPFACKGSTSHSNALAGHEFWREVCPM